MVKQSLQRTPQLVEGRPVVANTVAKMRCNLVAVLVAECGQRLAQRSLEAALNSSAKGFSLSLLDVVR